MIPQVYVPTALLSRGSVNDFPAAIQRPIWFNKAFDAIFGGDPVGNFRINNSFWNAW